MPPLLHTRRLLGKRLFSCRSFANYCNIWSGCSVDGTDHIRCNRYALRPLSLSSISNSLYVLQPSLLSSMKSGPENGLVSKQDQSLLGLCLLFSAVNLASLLFSALSHSPLCVSDQRSSSCWSISNLMLAVNEQGTFLFTIAVHILPEITRSRDGSWRTTLALVGGIICPYFLAMGHAH